jgi:hypothetical protein
MYLREHKTSFSRHDLPEFCWMQTPDREEGAGNAGCLMHPQPPMRKIKSTRAKSPQVHRSDPGIPCAMVLTVSFVVSPETGFVASVTGAMQSIVAGLAPASGCQDATTSPSAHDALVSRATSVHRIPSTVGDDGRRPSFGRDARSFRRDLPDGVSKIFLRTGLDMQVADLPDGQITARLFQ